MDSVQFPSMLAHRGLELWSHLEGRSHARRDDVALDAAEGPRLGATQIARLNRLARRCRKQGKWSRIAAGAEAGAEREATVGDLADVLVGAID